MYWLQEKNSTFTESFYRLDPVTASDVKYTVAVSQGLRCVYMTTVSKQCYTHTPYVCSHVVINVSSFWVIHIHILDIHIRVLEVFHQGRVKMMELK